MLKLTFLTLSILISSFCYARIGIADWSVKTPGGNEINNFSDKTLYLKNGQELRWVSEWYFYHDYIIGILGNKNHYGDTIGYFAVNENSCRIDTFRHISDWKSFIDQRNLKPKIWVRWYSSDSSQLNGRLVYVFMLGFYFSVPILILFGIILYRAYKRESFSRRKPYTLILQVLLVLFFLIWLADTFPQSW